MTKHLNKSQLLSYTSHVSGDSELAVIMMDRAQKALTNTDSSTDSADLPRTNHQGAKFLLGPRIPSTLTPPSQRGLWQVFLKGWELPLLPALQVLHGN